MIEDTNSQKIGPKRCDEDFQRQDGNTPTVPVNGGPVLFNSQTTGCVRINNAMVYSLFSFNCFIFSEVYFRKLASENPQTLSLK